MPEAHFLRATLALLPLTFLVVRVWLLLADFARLLVLATALLEERFLLLAETFDFLLDEERATDLPLTLRGSSNVRRWPVLRRALEDSLFQPATLEALTP